MKNYYEILNISPNATAAIITVAYKTLVKIYHPDVAQGNKEDAGEKIIEINEAYETLSNPEKKQQYDKKFFRGKQSKAEENFKEENIPSKIDGWEIVEQFYPKAEAERKNLEKLDTHLSLLFQIELISSKQYEESTAYFKACRDIFLIAKFGDKEKTREFGEFLILNQFPHIADELEKQINILGNAKYREIINNLKSQFATEIYGQSLQDIDEWLDYFEKYFSEYEFETEKDLTIEFDRNWSIFDDEFVLEVRINEFIPAGVFKPALYKTSLRIDIDVVSCKILFRDSGSSKTLKATYETDAQAFALIRNRIEKIYKFDD